MQQISEAIVAGSLEAIAKQPTEAHRKVAKTLLQAGGYGNQKPNRASRRKQAALQRRRQSRGKVEA